MSKKTIAAFSKAYFLKVMADNNITDETVGNLKKAAFISINNTEPVGDTPPPFTQEHSNVFTVYFDDVESDNIPIIKEGQTIAWARPLLPEQALNLIKFIKNNEDKDLFIIHCTAGICRSGGVAAYLNEYFQQDHEEFKKTNPYIHPNTHVLVTLRRAKEAFDILYPPVQNASAIIYPNKQTNIDDGTIEA